MKCNDCEHIIDDDSVFCKFCGKYLGEGDQNEITLNTYPLKEKIEYSEDKSILFSFKAFDRKEYEIEPGCRHIYQDAFPPADYIEYDDPYYEESMGFDTPDYYVGNNLTSLILPSSLLSIGARALYGCKNLTSLVLPKRLMYVDAYALACCVNLIELHIKSGLIEFGEGPFLWCRKLKKIYIPSGTIGDFGAKLPNLKHLLIED